MLMLVSNIVNFHFEHMAKVRKLKWNMRAKKHPQISMRGNRVYKGLHSPIMTILTNASW